MDGIGLVFAGGGGKGAYQIGVWKALVEMDVAQNITAVSGTSVGALNAALFAHGNYEVAEEIYRNIKHSQILTLTKTDLIRISTELLLKQNSRTTIFGDKNSSIFSREGMIEIINEYINLNKLSCSAIKCIATCHDVFKARPKYFNLNGQNETKITNILLASSALPVIFEPVQIDGVTYYDGGMSDNVPVLPIYELGYKTIIVVHLDRGSYIDKRLFPGTTLIQIVPKESQGDFITGTLDFSKEGAIARMVQGYENTIEIFSHLQNLNETGNKLSEVLEFIKNDNKSTALEVSGLISEINVLKKEISKIISQGDSKWKK